MFDRINIHSSIPVYEQIEYQVRIALASGRLKAGDRLPSINTVTEQLGVNANTVVRAFQDLTYMGIVHGRRGMGTFILEDAAAKCRDAVREEIIGRFHEIISEAKASGMTAKEVKTCLDALYAAAPDADKLEAAVKSLIKGK
ncbi:MAG: GntR family transcriptional regulator [Candidatus Hydrogenedentes bacterium]|nr:GntR family transcriptional regulator [Candidatus Hydrogenedentota bacterium]